MNAGVEDTPGDVPDPLVNGHGIQFPEPPIDTPALSVEDVRDVVEAVRAERADQVSREGTSFERPRLSCHHE